MEIRKKQRTRTLLISVFILWNFSLFCLGQFGPDDPIGNEDTGPSTIAFVEVDDIPPFVQCGPDIVRQSPVSTGGLSVAFTECTATDDSGAVVLVSNSHTPGDFFPFGTTVVTYTFTDAAGNIGTDSFTITIERADMDPPALNDCPTSPVTAFLVPGETMITRQLPVVTATDDGGIQLQQVPSSNQFQVGVTRVTVHAIDSSGNTAICTYNVVVFSRK
ncbi:Hyalin [Holothuria leucospilota]|uniref:Hyalin n=1 Tax=Holothuria leucospilota TaxID=206669 RepID=A0A9Q1HE37_HOLLE|nr:Hyalin [Holothuria leucospilota]